MLCLCAHLHLRLKRKSIFRSGVETSIDLGLGCFVQETDMSIPIKAIRRFLSPEADHACGPLCMVSMLVLLIHDKYSGDLSGK